MIKIDAEGAEGQIIEGAMKTLNNCEAKIIMEFWPFALKQAGTDPSELLSRLGRLGFTSKLIDVRGLDSDKTTGLSVEETAKHLEDSRSFMNILVEKTKPR